MEPPNFENVVEPLPFGNHLEVWTASLAKPLAHFLSTLMHSEPENTSDDLKIIRTYKQTAVYNSLHAGSHSGVT